MMIANEQGSHVLSLVILAKIGLTVLLKKQPMKSTPVYRLGRFISQLMGCCLYAALFASCASEPTVPENTSQTYDAVGVVKTITPSKNFVNIDHEDISGFMDAMAMFFPVSDTSILQNIAVNDSVVFTIEIIEGQAGISSIKVKD